jgi:cytidylate kinase
MNPMRKINIAVDGFSSCGKSTIARELAKKLNYTYIDSGAMYRAVALYAIQKKWITEAGIDEVSLQHGISEIKIAFKTNDLGQQETYLNDENVEKGIRTLAVANGASRVSAIGFVRKELVRQQQEMGREKGVVMDGRDIGTVVFPDAELKIFLTALPEVRAKRRFDEMTAKGEAPQFEEVLINVKERDERDTTRAESPLYKADDAIELDNSEFTIEGQLEFAVDLLIRLFGDLTNNQINK